MTSYALLQRGEKMLRRVSSLLAPRTLSTTIATFKSEKVSVWDCNEDKEAIHTFIIQKLSILVYILLQNLFYCPDVVYILIEMMT